MRPVRPRFTVRRLMVLTGIAGAILGGAAWGAKIHRLSRHYSTRANYYERRYDANPKNPSAKIREWEYNMMKKYQILTMFPWSPVGPDPPEPR